MAEAFAWFALAVAVTALCGTATCAWAADDVSASAGTDTVAAAVDDAAADADADADDATVDGAADDVAASTSTAVDPVQITVAGLTNASTILDGSTVTFTGEVVGDAVHGENGMEWLTLYADQSSIPVYVTAEDVTLVQNFGSYGVQGSLLQITGVYHLECQDHQGESDVHATSVLLLEPGEVQTSVYDAGYLYFAVIVLVLAGALLTVYYLLRRRLR